MSVKYHLQRQGRTFGPVSGKQLQKLAANGELGRDDLVRREDRANWVPAGSINGLFAALPPGPGEARTSGHAALPASSPVAAQDENELLSSAETRWRPLAERYSREYELGMHQFLAAVTGSACLLLLILSTLMTWEHWAMQAGSAMEGAGNAVSYSGLDVLEGKFVCLLAVIGMAAFGATLVIKRLLPVSLLVAAAVGTCSLLLALSYRHQINEYDAESAREARVLAENFAATMGEEEGEAASELFIPRETDVPALGLYVALLASLVVALTFAFAALFKPILLPFLQTESVHPLARKHGALLLSQAVALLLGLADYVLQF